MRKASNLRTARIAGAVSLVVGAGAASILFVDYLAERAKLRVAVLPPAQVAQDDAPTGPTRLGLAGASPSGSFSRQVEGMIVQPAAAAPGRTAVPANPHAVEPVPDAIVQDNAAPAARADGTVTAAIGPQATDPAMPADAPAVRPGAAEAAQPPGYEPAPKVVKTVKIAAIDPSATTPSEETAAEDVPDELVPVTPTPAPPRPKAAKSTPDKPAPKSASLEKPKEAKAAARQAPGSLSGSARINRHVNLRVKPDNDAKVVTIVPVNARVNVLYCKDWCEITYGSKRGYVYKRFIGKS